jgi:hypothetical protein
MPLAVAMQASAPSSAASRSCSVVTVGVGEAGVDVAGLGAGKTRRGLAALRKTKLEVR